MIYRQALKTDHELIFFVWQLNVNRLAGKADIFIYHKFENTEKLQNTAKNIHLQFAEYHFPDAVCTRIFPKRTERYQIMLASWIITRNSMPITILMT